MRRPLSCRIALATALALTLSGGAGAEGDVLDESQRWVPGLAVHFDVIGQRSGGEVESGMITGAPLDDGDPGTQDGCGNGMDNRVDPDGLCEEPVASSPILTPPSSGSDTTTAALVGLSFELMSPRLIEDFGKPRLFAHADAALVFGFKRNLAGTGSPGRLELPPRSAAGDLPTTISEETISGQGNRVFSTLKGPLVSAGAGVAFTMDVWGRRLRIKPSVEYLRQEVEFLGIANRAVQLRGSSRNRPESLDDYRLLSFRADRTRIQHGIGGGLELEADTQRLGPLMLTVFLSGRVYHLLGDLDETLTSSTNRLGPSIAGEDVTWHFRPENLAWRGAVGVRFRFLPE